LPAYVAGWDAAILPLVVRPTRRPHNAHRIPELLAAGRPVVATSVPDLVEPYRALDLVRVANTPTELSRAIDESIREDAHLRLARADRWLATLAWDQTWQGMDGLISAAVAARRARRHGLRAV
jgi:UDP-galactopyranose mutase